MTISLLHSFTSAIPDDPAAVAAGEVVPSNWNAQHLLTQASGVLLGRTTAATGATEEITPSSAFTFTGLSLDLASTITAGGPTGSATVTPIITYDAKGRLTAVSSATITPAVGSITGLGTGVATALGNTAGGSGGFALVGTTPPTGTAGGELAGTYPNPTLLRSISPTWTGNWTFNPASGNALTINPASGTNAEGFVITQTGHNTGTGEPSVNFNTITVNDGTNATSNSNYSTPLYVQQTILSAAGGQKYALFVNSIHNIATTTGGDQIGAVFFAQSTATNGGTNTGAGAVGTLFGGNSIGDAESGALNYSIVAAHEFDTVIATGASAKNRLGVHIASAGTVNGATIDAAISITSGGISWGTAAISLNALSGNAPLATTASLIVGDGTSRTITNGISLPEYTITGNIFNFGTPFKVTGAGALSAAVSATTPILYGNTIAGGSLTLQSTSNGSPSGDTVVINQAGLTRATFQTPSSGVPGLVINQNATAPPTPSRSGITLALLDTTPGGYIVNAFGSNGSNIFVRANGTNASPSQVTSGNTIGAFNFQGYDGSGVYSGTQTQIAVTAAETWVDATHRGTNIIFLTTPTATAALTQAMEIWASGGVSVGTATDPGIGLIYQNSASFLMRTKTSWSTGAAAALGTLTNAPSAGNPTKWIPVDDNGTTRYIPAW